MAAMMGLTTQNWSVAWRTHYNSVMRHPNKQGQHGGGGGMMGGEAHQNLFVHLIRWKRSVTALKPAQWHFPSYPFSAPFNFGTYYNNLSCLLSFVVSAFPGKL